MEFALQLAFLFLTVAIFCLIQNIPKQALTKLRTRSRTSLQTNRHFVRGSHLLARARSTKNHTTSKTLAKDALAEADLALSIDPRDAAAHILKALALGHLGHASAAVKSLDAALSPPAAKSLSDRERGDALFKRAELRLGVAKRRRVDSVVADLKEAVRLSPENSAALCLLGKCYEGKRMWVEARRAFEEVRVVEPGSVLAREGLNRLDSIEAYALSSHN